MLTELTRRMFIAGGIASYAASAGAKTSAYEVVPERSRVAFMFTISGIQESGTLPLERADITVDTENLARSQAEVTADVRKIKSNVFFATEAIKSASLLDAANYPLVRFSSTRILLGSAGRISEGARIEGLLTLRGVTQPIVLDATLSRPAGTAANDLSVLNIQLSGTLSRAAFGATGFAGLAEDTVSLDIRTEIRMRA